MRMICFGLSLLVPVMPMRAAETSGPSAEAVEFFESRIRPVLTEQCASCHNSADVAEAGFAVDSRAALRAGGDSGAVIVPGEPEKSRLLAILRHEVAGLEMPQDGPKLNNRVLRDFEAWIAMGAPDPRTGSAPAPELAEATSWETIRRRRQQWWSFQPIREPDLPDVTDKAWSEHPVDRFVLARLEEEQLTPSEPADAASLVRRVFYTLLGLPPTPEQVEQWTVRLSTADQSDRDAAFEALVDELLESPHFGERWARHWMDWIRYAESHGSEGDPAIEGAWRYRDYLIRALNADVPYDQLIREHVAGDLLVEPRTNEELGINESLIGTAHWRMVFHGFAPTDALDERVRFTDDQINAFSKAFLGLTVSCARCHDHKFDAVSQRDYYALFGILRSCRPGRVVIDLPERQRRNCDELAALKPRIRSGMADAWLSSLPELRERLRDPEGPVAEAEEPQSLLHPLFLMRRNVPDDAPPDEFLEAWGERVVAWNADCEAREKQERRAATEHWNLADAADHAQWYRTGIGLTDAPQPPGTFAVSPEGEDILTGIYPAGVYSHGLSAKHAARFSSPDVPIPDDYELWVRATGGGGATARYAVHDYPRQGTVYPVTKLGGWKWHRYDLSYWSGEEIHVELATAGDAPLLVEDADRSWFGVREVLLQPKRAAAPPAEPLEHFDPLFALAGGRPPQSFAALADLYVDVLAKSVRAWRDGRATDGDAFLLGAALKQELLPNKLSDLPQVAQLIAEYRNLESDVPVPTRVPSLQETAGRDNPLFERGDHRQPGDLVPRRFLEAIDATPYITAGSGRLQLAEDLLRDDNPFTRRVIVNRLWHHLFGAGIVATPDNFGRLGETPTHPELLDWLAMRFEREGWSLKQAIRLMITSRSWRQSSRPSAGSREIDPDNRLLSHAHVRRLEAEAIRDGLLAASGALDRRLYGPPVEGDSTRRSVYVGVRRNALDPFLRTFDFPEPFSTVGRRDVTNVPAQSLVWMNDERVHRFAAALTARGAGISDEARIRMIFLSVLNRQPIADEVQRLHAFLEQADASHAETLARAGALRREVEKHRAAITGILEPVRERLRGHRSRPSRSRKETVPAPIARWEFNGDARDSIGSAHGTLREGARVEAGALILDGRRAHVVTGTLERDLRAKTLEAWVRLDDLDQSGGGVISVQTPDGHVFDAIVFGENAPGEWLAGSDHFRRTKALGGPRETEAMQRPIHVAIVYHADGRIEAFRDGFRYGTSYESEGPVTFPQGKTVVSFGVRHLPAGGNKLLAGRIERAQLYDRALTDDEVAASAAAVTGFVADEEVIAALVPDTRRCYEQHREALGDAKEHLAALGPLPEQFDENAAWHQLALAMFTLKEFIYLR